MNFPPRCLLLLVLFALAPGPAGGQPADGDAKVNLDFRETELTEVISTIAKLTGRNFLYDDRVRGRVTVISPEPVTVDAAYRVFESILQVKGFTTVPGPGGILKIVPTRDAKQSPIRTVPSGQPVANRDLYITRLLPLKYVKADAISSTLGPLVSKDASVIAYTPTNTLIITDISSNIRRLVGIINQIDVETYREDIKVIPIQYADANQLAQHLQQVFQTEAPAAAPRRPRARGQAARGAAAAAAADDSAFGTAGSARFITDARTNSIIVIATRAGMAEIERVIQLLDYQRKGSGSIHVYRLQNADSEEMASTLASLTTGAGSGRATPVGAGGAPAAAAAAVADLGEGVRVTADPPTNSLIIQANSEAFSALTEVIEALDIRRPQVLVEALIMEVDVTDGSSFGSSFLYRSSSDSIPQIAIGGTNVANTPDAPAASGGFGTSPDFTTGQFTSAVLGRIVEIINPDGTTDFVPAIQGILTAAQTDNDLNIVSAPTILTADNEEAEIVVGQEIPVPTTRLQTADSSAAGGFQTSQNISRQDVGVTLRVTPQISEGDTVRLNIFQEISEVQSSDPELGPTTTNRQVENTVYVRDGEAVMIGGILSEIQTDSENKIPFLGDIPILGWAFKGVATSVRKVNLVVVLTPRIVRDPDDLKRLTVENRERFRDSARDGMNFSEQEQKERQAALRAGVELPVDRNPVRRKLDSHTSRYPTEQLPQLRREQREREQTRREAIDELKAREAAGSYVVQVSIFRNVNGAIDLLENLAKSGYDGSIFSRQEGAETLHSVQLGPYLTENQAQTIARELRASFDVGAMVIVEP